MAGEAESGIPLAALDTPLANSEILDPETPTATAATRTAAKLRERRSEWSARIPLKSRPIVTIATLHSYSTKTNRAKDSWADQLTRQTNFS